MPRRSCRTPNTQHLEINTPNIKRNRKMAADIRHETGRVMKQFPNSVTPLSTQCHFYMNPEAVGCPIHPSTQLYPTRAERGAWANQPRYRETFTFHKFPRRRVLWLYIQPRRRRHGGKEAPQDGSGNSFGPNV